MSLDALTQKLLDAQRERRAEHAAAQAPAVVPDEVKTSEEKPADSTAQDAAPAADVASDGGKARPVFKAVAVDDQGVIYGIASMVTVDREGEIVEKGALLQMAYDFCASKARQFLFNHDKDAPLDADLVASIPGAPILKSGRVLKAGESLPDDDPVVGIDIQKGNEIAWFVGLKPHDSRVLEQARKGGHGFSWGGYASKE